VLNLIGSLLFAGLAFFRTRRQLAVDILALRHQLGVVLATSAIRHAIAQQPPLSWRAWLRPALLTRGAASRTRARALA
jgi:hypothetical protein